MSPASDYTWETSDITCPDVHWLSWQQQQEPPAGSSSSRLLAMAELAVTGKYDALVLQSCSTTWTHALASLLAWHATMGSSSSSTLAVHSQLPSHDQPPCLPCHTWLACAKAC
jgi:hypothetical protein